jgi:DNA-binding PadR family transcriptional regulator
MSPGTLYRSVQRMVEQGLIVETDERPDAEFDDERRRYYRITTLGKQTARAEAARMSSLLEQARAMGLVPKGQGVR